MYFSVRSKQDGSLDSSDTKRAENRRELRVKEKAVTTQSCKFYDQLLMLTHTPQYHMALVPVVGRPNTDRITRTLLSKTNVGVHFLSVYLSVHVHVVLYPFLRMFFNLTHETHGRSGQSDQCCNWMRFGTQLGISAHSPTQFSRWQYHLCWCWQFACRYTYHGVGRLYHRVGRFYK